MERGGWGTAAGGAVLSGHFGLGGGGDPFEVERVFATGGRQVFGLKASESRSIPVDLDYGGIPGLSWKMGDKVRRLRQVTLGQASRILGVAPAAVSVLDIRLSERGWCSTSNGVGWGTAVGGAAVFEHFGFWAAETRMKCWGYLLEEVSRVARVPEVTPAAVSVLDICFS